MSKLKLLLLLTISLYVAACSFRAKKTVLYDGSKTAIFTGQRDKEGKYYKRLFTLRNSLNLPSRYNGVVTTSEESNGITIRFDSLPLYMASCDSRYEPVFTTGLVSLQAFYKAGDVETDAGSAFFVRGIELLNHAGSAPNQRRFLIEGSYHGLDISYYLLELTNNKAKKTTGLSEFVKDAKVTFFKLGWIEV